ncbi:hypothetical protein B0O80DRAFT_432504 [Mortierella sp. GBAus27b]|nr:hypothetical protein B0O80DRAFT_432504 [Mortierella sp. GBAus27b]
MNDQKLHPLDISPPDPTSSAHPLSPASVTSNVTFHDSVKDKVSSPQQATAPSAPSRLRYRPDRSATGIVEDSSAPFTGFGSNVTSTATGTTGDGLGISGGIGRRPSGQGGRPLTGVACSELEIPPSRSRFTQFLKETYERYSPSLTLENKGSIARDHLANERTYLAWLRSSLSLITVGVAITQLFRLQSTSSPTNSHPSLDKVTELGRPLGGSFIALGILFLWLGTSRYFHSQNVLSYGQFPASRGSVIIATVTVMAVLMACFIIVIVQGRTT